MKLKSTDLNKKVLIIAEVGNNHEGNFNRAKKLLIEAKKSGADLVKFQSINPSEFVREKDKKRFLQLKKFQFSEKKIKDLYKIAKKNKIDLFFTFFDVGSLDRFKKYQKYFKIASCDNNNFELIKFVKKLNKPSFISTGIADMKLLVKLYNYLGNKKKNFTFLNCISDYPANIKNLNLGVYKLLKKKFPKVKVGYSDHTIGIEACCYSVIQGAEVIEKHFTLNKKQSKFTDHQLSANPNEFRELVNSIRKIEMILINSNNQIKNLSYGEQKNRSLFRRSIYASRDLKKGDRIKRSFLKILRPEIGVSCENLDKVINKVLAKDIKKGDPILKDNYR